jgi:glycogen phosphorylase
LATASTYEYGLFKQLFTYGYQREKPDHWMVHGTPWQIERPDEACVVPLFGRLERLEDRDENPISTWVDWRVIIGIPHDMPMVGFGGSTVNYMRLYNARSSDDFDMAIFNQGDYIRAIEQKISSETISKVLYPSDAVDQGKELRLIQEYFFVACAIRDAIRRYLLDNDSFDDFSNQVAIQLNDTHPALAVAELMRALMDEHKLGWDDAWTTTCATLGYTNHTLLPEALEKRAAPLVEHVLPRHMQIIYEVNLRFMQDMLKRYPKDESRRAALSIIEEGPVKQVRMANLAIVGSHSVNGVAALHSDLVKSHLVPHFNEL